MAGSARAQSSDSAVAEQLFVEAKEAMDADPPRYAEACEKLERSLELDAAVGTHLNLAVCYERSGRTASAWLAFRDAAAAARAEGQDKRAQFARERADALEGRVSKLVLDVPSAGMEGVTLRLDGRELHRAAWGEPVAVDAGRHVLAARVRSDEYWREEVVVADGQAPRTFSVPLPPATAASAAPEPDPDPEPPPQPNQPSPAGDVPADPQQGEVAGGGTSQRYLAYGLGGLGAVGLGLSGYFALETTRLERKSNEDCDGNECGDRGTRLRRDALRMGDWATWTGVGGLALLGAAGVLWLTLPDDSATVGFGPTSVRARVVF